MSVFVGGEEPETTPPPRRKKYQTKYNTKYESEYVWVSPSLKGDTYALCRWCQVDICIKSVGAKGLRDHEITGRHKQKASEQPLQQPSTNPHNSAVYPVLEVEGGVDQSGAELLGSPRPVTPQTPNTPLSPHGEEIPHPQPSLLDLGNQLQSTPTRISSAIPSLHTNEKSVEEKLVIEYDEPASCTRSDGNQTKESVNATTIKKEETVEKCLTSTDDLTCNICGQEYAQWTQLKKHLLDHIMIAQNSSQSKAKKKTTVDLGNKKRGRPPGRKTKMESPEAACIGSQQHQRRTARKRNSQRSARHQTNTDDTNEYKPNTVCIGEAIQGVGEAAQTKEPECDNNEEDYKEVTVSDEDVGEEDSGKQRTGPLQCRVCREIFYNRGELREHQRTEHNNGRPYQCSRCDKYFTTKNHMEVHVKHKHTPGPNPCQCVMCGKVLSSRTNLRIHMRIHKGERPYECPVCHKAFSRKANMEMHVVYHTGERRFTCEVCGQSFFAINALKRHTKLHTGERDYACEVCGATYVTGTDLRRHKLKHDEVKPYPCQLCDKQFTRSHDLKVHMSYHNKDLRYTCNVCNKQFVESGNYKRHMRRHTGERPYSCGICLLTFSQVHHLKTHMRTNHSDDAANTEEAHVAGRVRLLPHRNPRLATKRPPKYPQVPHTPIHPSQGQPQPHLPAHPQCTPQTGDGVSLNTSQPVSIPITNSVTVPGTSAATQTTQITTSGGVNHPAAMTGFLHQYNSQLYNHSVMPHYPTLFDMCPQQNCVNHLPSH